MKTARPLKKHTPLVIGNWKMNPKTLEKARSLAAELKKRVGKKDMHAQVYIAPPFPFIAEAGKVSAKTRFNLAAQDASAALEGAYTGEVSLAMLKSIDVSLVIAGHSERRACGETNEAVAKKAAQILKQGLIAVVCVGEKKRDSQGDYFSFIEAQLRPLFKEIPASALRRLVIAYEPIWAIGTGKHATAEDVQEMKLFIQKVLSDALGRTAVAKVRILYGGSVTKDNAHVLFETGTADGFLVGGASLKADEFCEIIHIADRYDA